MMDFILELVMTIIFEGAVEAVTEKRVPMLIRVLLAILLLSFYLGLVGMFIYLGIRDKSGICMGAAVLLFVLVTAVVVRKYREIR